MTDHETAPLARTDRVVVEELDGEVLVYDLAADRVHCLNPAAAVVWRHCDGRRTVGELAALVAPDRDGEIGAELARHAVWQLGRADLLVDPQAAVQAGLSRRQLLARVGGAAIAGLALPVVGSIVAPTPAAAATCLASGAACTTGTQCCSGVCQGGGTCA